jgi:hypothetical protein
MSARLLRMVWNDLLADTMLRVAAGHHLVR